MNTAAPPSTERDAFESTPARMKHRLTPRRRPRDRVGRALLQMGVMAAFFGAWEACARWADVFFLPPISEIVARASELWFSGPASSLFLTPAAMTDIGSSVYRTLVGFGAGALVGIAIGVVIGLSPRLGSYLEPLLHFVRGVPKSALLPLFIILLGVGDALKIGLIVIGMSIYLAVNAIEGVRSVTPLQLELCQVYSIPPRKRILRVVLPSASPTIFAGLRFGLAVSLTVMVISEMYVADSGIGYFTILAQRSFAVVDMWAGVLAIGVLGSAFSIGLSVIERRVLRWHIGMQARTI